jgi:hypothetical protein
MFAQVACLVCGKPFQVAKEKLGHRVPCPWCATITDAVPVSVDVQPLPADGDLTPRPPLRGGEGVDAPPKHRPRVFLWAGYAALLLLVAGGVFVGLRLFGGAELAEFTAPDGSCRVLLPGAARERPVHREVSDDWLRGGKRYSTTPGWFSRYEGQVGWFDLPAEDAKLIRPDDLFRTLRDRRTEELGASPDGEGVVRVDALSGLEVRFANGSVRHVERYLFDPTAARPRVYWVSVGGADFDPDSATARKVLGSLRVLGDGR